MNAPHGEGKDQQSVQPGSSKVESMESGMVISGAKKIVDVGANDDLPSEVVNMPGKHAYWSCFVDMVQVREFVHHGECDHRVDI